MSTEEQQVLDQQRQRRARVSRMRKAIVVVIALWMILSMIAIVTLSVIVGVQSRRIHRLENLTLQMQSDYSTSAADGGSNQHQDPYADVVRGIDSSDNFADKGDTHYVYLTFDCTPGENTNAVLDVLKQYQVKATFFVTGDDSEEAKAIYQRIVEEGHAIGMRSYSNQMSEIYSSVEQFETDYAKIQKLISQTTGQECHLYRFPGGSGNGISNLDMAEFVHVLNADHTRYFDWNVSAGDAAADYTTESVIANVTEGVSQYKTSVVLLHDDVTKSTTVEALGPLIETLTQSGMQILPIDDQTKAIQYIRADSVE